MPGCSGVRVGIEPSPVSRAPPGRPRQSHRRGHTHALAVLRHVVLPPSGLAILLKALSTPTGEQHSQAQSTISVTQQVLQSDFTPTECSVEDSATHDGSIRMM